MAKIVFVLFLVHVVSAEGVGLDDPLPPFVVFDSGETNFTVPVDAVSESATDARGTDGAADEQALEERKNSTDVGSREKDVIFPVTVNETITDVRAVVGDQLQCVECDGYYPCIFNRQIVACKSANTTGCTTTYGNANKDGVIAMGCFDPKDNEERFASSCVTYEDGRFVCSCIGNVCNLAYVQSPSFTEGGLICWQCDGDEECNKRELDKIMTCDRRVYSSCLTVFETVEDARKGAEVSYRGCGKKKPNVFWCHDNDEIPGKGKAACWCRGEYCNYQRRSRSCAVLHSIDIFVTFSVTLFTLTAIWKCSLRC